MSAADNVYRLPDREPPPDGVKRGRLTSGRQDTPRPRWLGVGWLLRGAVNVLVGDEGIGKSLWWVSVAAQVTTGRADHSLGLPRREPADVVVIATEDSWADVQERIAQAGGDLDRVLRYQGDDDDGDAPTFPEYTEDLLAAVAGRTVGLIVVDTWLDTVGAGLAVRDTQQATKSLAPWRHIASEMDAAALLIGHTNRVSTDNARDATGATSALRKKARVFLFALRPDDPDGNPVQGVVIVGPEKANGTTLSHAIEYDIRAVQLRDPSDDDPGTIAELVYARTLDDTMPRLVRGRHTARAERVADRRGGPKQDAAEQFIREYIAERGGGPVETRAMDQAFAAWRRSTPDAPSASTYRDVKTALGTSALLGGVGTPWTFTLNPIEEP